MRIFDTTFIIDLVDGDESAKALAEKIDGEQGFNVISVVTVQEYLRGIYYLFSSTKVLKAKLEKAESELQRFEIIPYSYDIAKIAALMEAELARKGTVIGMADTIIAATALHLDLSVVTRDREHFERIPKINIETY
jgi:predicted nucleic acid-binding protein